jgi:hypothetical protein
MKFSHLFGSLLALIAASTATGCAAPETGAELENVADSEITALVANLVPFNDAGDVAGAPQRPHQERWIKVPRGSVAAKNTGIKSHRIAFAKNPLRKPNGDLNIVAQAVLQPGGTLRHPELFTRSDSFSWLFVYESDKPDAAVVARYAVGLNTKALDEAAVSDPPCGQVCMRQENGHSDCVSFPACPTAR